jgi:hypothetical protein
MRSGAVFQTRLTHSSSCGSEFTALMMSHCVTGLPVEFASPKSQSDSNLFPLCVTKMK